MTKEEYLSMYNIIGAAMEVHRQLGRGLNELIYQEALEIELKLQGIIVEREKELDLWYKGMKMKKKYFVDMYYKGLVIELKSVSELHSEHRAQLLNYMRISKNQRGILVNFGEKSLRVERYLFVSDIDDFVLINENNYLKYIDN